MNIFAIWMRFCNTYSAWLLCRRYRWMNFIGEADWLPFALELWGCALKLGRESLTGVFTPPLIRLLKGIPCNCDRCACVSAPFDEELSGDFVGVDILELLCDMTFLSAWAILLRWICGLLCAIGLWRAAAGKGALSLLISMFGYLRVGCAFIGFPSLIRICSRAHIRLAAINRLRKWLHPVLCARQLNLN